MHPTNHSIILTRRRKMLLVLPLLILPFLTLAFWSLGGGISKGSGSEHGKRLSHDGLNLQIPDAKFTDDKILDKLAYYDKAAHDSAKHEELIRNDPFIKLKNIAVTDSTRFSNADSNEQKIYTKIAQLDQVLNERNSALAPSSFYNRIRENKDHAPAINSNTDRLENMMRSIEQNNSAADPQMNQLSGMLDKIMDIQHPERLSEQLKKNSVTRTGIIFPVTLDRPNDHVTLLVNEQEIHSPLRPVTGGAFYSTDDKPQLTSGNANPIEAVIHETRVIVNGSIVKMRILTDVFIDGTLIPKESFVWGKASLNGERLNIEIPTIRYGRSIFPVSLQVYDMDGMDGIFIPGAITRDAAKETSDRAIQGIALNALDPSLSAQAASAGIEAAKNLLAKKIKLVRVTVKAGYRVLLKNKSGF